MINLIFLFLLTAPAHVEYRQLTWEDFKGAAVFGNSRSAETITALEMTSDNVNGLYTFAVECYFIPEESWTITKDEKKLQHEQLHFAITRLYQQKIIQALIPFQGTSKVKEAEAIYKKITRQWKNTEIRYDKETFHSLDISAQKNWESMIQKQLR